MNPISTRKPDRRAVLAALAALPVAACGHRGAAALTLWAMSYEGDWSPLLMPPFEAATNAPVDVQSIPWTAAHEKLLTAHAGGALPDVFMLPTTWVPEFAMIGALAPVADTGLLADLFPGMASNLRFAGRDYTVPWSVAPQVLFFRRDILAASGFGAPASTWAEFTAMGHRLKARRPGSDVLLMLLNWWDALFAFIAATGVRPLRDHDTRGAFDRPEIREAIAFYIGLFADRLAPKVLSTEVEDPIAAFARGDFAIWPSGPSVLTDLRRRAPELSAAKWGTSPMPGPVGAARSPGIGACLCVAATTRRPDLAWALVRHLTAPASQLRMQTYIGSLPTRPSAWTSPTLATPALAPFAAQLGAPSMDPPIAEWERIRIEVQLIAERMVRGQYGLDAGIAAMNRRTDQLLGRRRELVEAGQRI